LPQRLLAGNVLDQSSQLIVGHDVGVGKDLAVDGARIDYDAGDKLAHVELAGEGVSHVAIAGYDATVRRQQVVEAAGGNEGGGQGQLGPPADVDDGEGEVQGEDVVEDIEFLAEVC
jgi:hypothetical protein